MAGGGNEVGGQAAGAAAVAAVAAKAANDLVKCVHLISDGDIQTILAPLRASGFDLPVGFDSYSKVKQCQVIQVIVETIRARKGQSSDIGVASDFISGEMF